MVVAYYKLEALRFVAYYKHFSLIAGNHLLYIYVYAYVYRKCGSDPNRDEWVSGTLVQGQQAKDEVRKMPQCAIKKAFKNQVW